MPCCAAVVAAPALKLWPPNCCGSSPIICNAFRNSTTNLCWVNGAPFWKWKRGPGALPLRTIQESTAATGHNWPPVLPIPTIAPFPAWSVFDRFSRICSCWGFVGLSTSTSGKVKWSLSLKDPEGGAHISPERKNPKKHSSIAAQSIVLSCTKGSFSQPSLIRSRIPGVIGSLVNRDFVGRVVRTPLSTWDNLGIFSILGSGSPFAMCSWRVADKYTFMVLWAIPLFANTVTKRHSVLSDAGSGGIVACSQNSK